MTDKKRELVLSVSIKDCRVDTYRGSGAGGQHRNKTSSAVRVTHEPSGAIGQSEDERSQLVNKKVAFRRMAESEKFRAWLRTTAAGLESIDKIVERQMAPENLKIEQGDGYRRWEPYVPE